MVRLGKFGATGPRPIKIITSSREERNRLLQLSRDNRDKTFMKNVYFDSDKCALDRKEAARLRERARTLRQEHPEKKIFIKKGQLYCDSSVVDHEDPLRDMFPHM